MSRCYEEMDMILEEDDDVGEDEIMEEILKANVSFDVSVHHDVPIDVSVHRDVCRRLKRVLPVGKLTIPEIILQVTVILHHHYRYVISLIHDV